MHYLRQEDVCEEWNIDTPGNNSPTWLFQESRSQDH